MPLNILSIIWGHFASMWRTFCSPSIMTRRPRHPSRSVSLPSDWTSKDQSLAFPTWSKKILFLTTTVWCCRYDNKTKDQPILHYTSNWDGAIIYFVSRITFSRILPNELDWLMNIFSSSMKNESKKRREITFQLGQLHCFLKLFV